MKRFIIGIDPGQKGCIAIIRDGVLEVHDLKGCYKETSSFNSLDPMLFYFLVMRTIPPASEDVAIFCEESLFVAGGVKASGKSMKSIYDSRGVMRTVLESREYKINYVQPQTWKRKFGLLKQDKAASVEKACEVFPESKDLFWKAQGSGFNPLDGRAEAALIAHYGLSFNPQPERKKHNVKKRKKTGINRKQAAETAGNAGR